MGSELSRAEIAAMRRSYGEISMDSISPDPFVAFAGWLHEAHQNAAIIEANAMVLSTVDHEGEITSRTVLLKDVSNQGFTFFTNYSSRKGKAIHSQPQVALLFPWYGMERQISITGIAEKVGRDESEAYFASRPWEHQIGAWASRQSELLSSREELEERWRAAGQRWPTGSLVPTPPEWGGYRVFPHTIEFWQGRYSRLHERIRYERSRTSVDINAEWEINHYYP